MGTDKNSALRYTWMRYLSDYDFLGTDFSNSKNDIIYELMHTNIIETEAGSFSSPLLLMSIPKRFRDESGAPLTLTAKTASSYLSRKYHESDNKKLETLNVKEMDFSTFVEHVGWMVTENARDFNQKGKKYHSLLARALLRELEDDVLLEDLKSLPIIRVRGGWVSAMESSLFFPGEKGGRECPDGLNATIVQGQYAKDENLRLLYEKLGVRPLSTDQICNLILATHEDPLFKPESLSIDELVSHVTFLYVSNWKGEKGSNLILAAENGRYYRAFQLYYQKSGVHKGNSQNKTANILRDSRLGCRFMHSAYFKANQGSEKAFTSWLRATLEIWTIPRLVAQAGDNFDMTPEFDAIIRNRPAVDFLLLLRDNWDKYSKHLLLGTEDDKNAHFNGSVIRLRQKLESAQVQCIGGYICPLSQTFLPFQDRLPEAESIPLLDIPEVEHERWSILEFFGVGMKGAVRFSLYCLESLASREFETADTLQRVTELYNNLNIRTEEDEAVVRYGGDCENAKASTNRHLAGMHSQLGG